MDPFAISTAALVLIVLVVCIALGLEIRKRAKTDQELSVAYSRVQDMHNFHQTSAQAITREADKRVAEARRREEVADASTVRALRGYAQVRDKHSLAVAVIGRIHEHATVAQSALEGKRRRAHAAKSLAAILAETQNALGMPDRPNGDQSSDSESSIGASATESTGETKTLAAVA